MGFGEKIKKAQAELVVSPRHDVWLVNNPNPQYSTEALKFAQEQLYWQGHPRNRKGTVSASSLGSCRRRQQFTFLGLPEAKPAPRTAQIFQNGTMMHIRWQMAGLTEGWLAQAEVPVGKNDLNLSGTIDGIADDDTIVEFKSINTDGYRGVNTFGPKHEHKTQVATYMLTTGREKAVIIYEDKNTQDYTEFVVPMDQELEFEVKASASQTWGLIKQENLAEPLPKCEEQTGVQYSTCPFRERCLMIRDWQDAKERAL